MGEERQQKKRSTRSHGSRGHRRPQSTFSGTTQDAAKEASSGACGGLFDDCRSEDHSKRKINGDDDDTGASKGRRYPSSVPAIKYMDMISRYQLATRHLKRLVLFSRYYVVSLSQNKNEISSL
jgi:hypothetical protein